MRAVHVGIGHDDDLVVADFVGVEVGPEAAAHGGDERANLLVGEHALQTRLLDVEHLAAQRQDRLRGAVPALLRRAAGRIALHEEELGLRGVAAGAVRQLARQPAALQRALAPRQVARLASRDARPRRVDRLLDELAGDRGVLVEERLELLAHEVVDDALDLVVAELRLRLPLELGVGDLHADDAGDAFADVLARHRLLVVLEQLRVARVVVDDARERRTEAREMRAALDRVDVVREGEDRLVVFLRDVLHRDFDADPVLLAAHRDHVVVEHRAPRVDRLHVADDAVLVDVGLLLARRLLREDDDDARVQERKLLEALRQEVPLEAAVLENLVVRVERHRGAGLRRFAHDVQRFGDMPLGEADAVDLAAAPHLHLHPLGQRVNAGHADAVQSARDLVAAGAELAARVQHGERHFDRRLVLGGVHVDRDAATVVPDRAGAVRVERDLHARAIAGHRLVDRIVHDLVDAVVVAALDRVADVHRRALADRLHALENLDLVGSVTFGALS